MTRLTLLALVGLVCQASSSLDGVFFQDVAFRSIFEGESGLDQPLPLPFSAWENLPFKSLPLGKWQMSAFPSLNCMVVISEGKLFASRRALAFTGC